MNFLPGMMLYLSRILKQDLCLSSLRTASDDDETRTSAVANNVHIVAVRKISDEITMDQKLANLLILLYA